jgi:3-isopropylmalate/(R)-2-methylmalate dehydratase large subunit
MGATIAEKIFSRTCGRKVRRGEVVMAPVDGAMIHDITGPLAIRNFFEMGGTKVFDPRKVILLFDHQVPADSIAAAENQVFMREFADRGITYDIGKDHHQVVTGRACGGKIIVGADSHTCMYGAAGAFATGIGSTDMGFVLKFGALYFRVPDTTRLDVSGKFPWRVGPKDLILSLLRDIGADGATYQAVEFTGETFSSMNMNGRMTCCNMAVEMGAKAGMVLISPTTTERPPGHARMVLENDRTQNSGTRIYDVSTSPRVAIHT